MATNSNPATYNGVAENKSQLSTHLSGKQIFVKCGQVYVKASRKHVLETASIDTIRTIFFRVQHPYIWIDSFNK